MQQLPSATDLKVVFLWMVERASDARILVGEDHAKRDQISFRERQLLAACSLAPTECATGLAGVR